MTVTSTSLGTNTVDINISGEQNPSLMISAIDTFLVAQGWAQYDIITPVNAAYAYQRIYRSVNFDGTFKYMQLFFYPWEQRIYIDFYESWNITTHVGTNKCYWGPMDVGAFVQYAYTGCDIVIMANTHWCVFQTIITTNSQANYGPWVGCFETMRDAVEDTTLAGYPCWFATTSYKLGNGATPISGVNTALESGVNGQAQHTVSFPRTTYGTGYLASMHSGVCTPYWGSGAPGGSTSPVTWAGNLASVFTSYAWNTANKIASSFRPRVQNELHGRTIGAKMMGAQYSEQSKISLPLDANYNFSSIGTATDHWVLPAPIVTYKNILQTVQGPSASYSNIASVLGSPKKVYLAGNGFYYICNGTNIYKVNSNSFQIVSILGLPSNIIDICFDGRYIYGITNIVNGNIFSIDTTNDVVTVGVAFGALTTPYSIACDDINVWVGCYYSTGPVARVMQIAKSNLAAITVTTSLTGSATCPYPAAIIPDNDGNVLVGGTQLLVYTQGQSYIYKISPGGTQTSVISGVYGGSVGLLLVSPRKAIAAHLWSNVTNYFYPFIQSISTDTFIQSLGISTTQTTATPVPSPQNAFYNQVMNSNFTKLSTIGSVLTIQNITMNYIGAIYINTATTLGSNSLGSTTLSYAYTDGTTTSNGSMFGEVKYNQYFGGNNTNLVITSNIFRPDDGYNVATLGCNAGRMVLPS